MDIKEALQRAEHWASNPRSRPQMDTVRLVVAELVQHHKRQADLLSVCQSLALGIPVLIERGNPSRGPETGPGHGRMVKAKIVGFGEVGHQIYCQLLEDDPHAVGGPTRAGEEGFWSISQINTHTS